MPRIKPAPDKQRQRYRERLAQGQRPAFDRLTKLITAPRPELRWYHAVGTLVRKLLPAAGERRGKRALAGLAQALGPCASLFQRAARFVHLYSSRANLARLEELGVDWTRLWLTFSVEDEKDREKLLSEAVHQKWRIEQVRYEVQQRHPSKRRGVGGRPRAKPRAYGPESTLRRLKQLSEGWLTFYEDAWSTVKSSEWKRLVRDCPKGDRGKLRTLLESTGATLVRVAAACEQARHRLPGELRQV